MPDTASVKYVDVVIHLRNDVCVCRRIVLPPDANILSMVNDCVGLAETKIGYEVLNIFVNQSTLSAYNKIKQTDIHFTNICGKITHYRVDYVLNSSVEPMIVPVENKFGRFFNLYGIECNLLTCMTKTFTLFRAARSSSGVCRAIEHALNPESVKKIEAYMLVASGAISNPVCMQCDYVNRVVARDNRWKASTVVKTEEGVHINGIKITDFDKDWIESFGEKIAAPSQMLINITKNGTVNMFLSVNAIFYEGMEFIYIPIFRTIMNLIDQNS